MSLFKQPIPTIQRKSKYRNVKTVVAGIKFDSKKEAHYYAKLLILQDYGEVTNIILQQPFEIIHNSIKICKYKADFTVTYKDNHVEVIDVKGMRTPLYRLKKKLVKAFYGIDIIEV
jgi:protein associated with RNAse G/E